MSKEWFACFEALKSVYAEEAFSNIAINEALAHHKGCAEGFVRNFAKGVIRDSMKLDWYVDRLADKGIRGIKIRTLIVIRMGLYAITELNSVPDHAAVNEAVGLAKTVAKGSDRFVNAILRSYLRRSDELQVPPKDMALRYSFPRDLYQLIRNQYSYETETILKALSKPAAMVLRVNLSKISREDLIEKLRSEGIMAEAADETNSGIIIEGGKAVSSEAFRDGLFSVQSLSSIIAIEKLAPESGSEVLDICAAPGGKTCAMAEIMGNKGNILACDIYEHRVDLIRASAERLGLGIISLKELDGTEYCNEFEKRFDYVLADVPCSGLGVIQSKPEIKYRTDVSRYPELIETQSAILRNALSYAKPGAVIEYSTCTINKDENEAVVKHVLSEGNLGQIIEMNTIMPYNYKVGFFYCLIRKKA